jgi:hypothetical protein
LPLALRASQKIETFLKALGCPHATKISRVKLERNFHNPFGICLQEKKRKKNFSLFFQLP